MVIKARYGVESHGGDGDVAWLQRQARGGASGPHYSAGSKSISVDWR